MTFRLFLPVVNYITAEVLACNRSVVRATPPTEQPWLVYTYKKYQNKWKQFETEKRRYETNILQSQCLSVRRQEQKERHNQESLQQR